MNEQAPTDLVEAPVIIGIGASAGGLEAFQQFLKGLPADHRLVLVLVQHLDPDHNSMMPELVSAKTKSPVHSVEDGMLVEPGHIYLIPPGFEMEIEGLRLRLEKFESPRGLRRPIDRFFTSLARSHGENAIAVVLSGTGSDGTNGAREIKSAGGLVFVQDPKQAKYDGMPQSVLDQGGADVISRAEEIVEVIGDYFTLRVGSYRGLDDESEFLERLMRHVRFRTGHDFNDYKSGTLMRRIAVRMSVLNIVSHTDYLKYVVDHKQEAEQLFRDLLINVTSFFRDRDHFEIMRRDVIPRIVENCEQQGEIRVWTAGCSTGEEAYSIAMLLAEETARTKHPCRVVVFGTDIDEQALARARAGQYSDAIAEQIPGDLLDRYFRATSSGYEVGTELRDIVRFSRHSFVKDPPFSKLDLVTCRNVMIYFKEPLQETAIKVFHYALNEGGYLFIGPSENPKTLARYFSEVSQRSRIYTRLPGLAKPLNLAQMTGTDRIRRPALPERPTEEGKPADVERRVLDAHAPGFLQVDREGEVVYASAGATPYLRVRAGRMTHELFTIIAEELDPVLRRLSRVGEQAGSRLEREYQGPINGQTARIVVVSERLSDGTVLYVFHDELMLRDDRPNSEPHSEEQEAYVRELERELDEARSAVRTTVEELETSNEELKSSNEEMMSMNEELQSANEELTTINDELQDKLRELNRANTDLQNFTQSARIATVFLDDDMKLKSFTNEAAEYFSFTTVDVGRHLVDLNSVMDHATLIELCRDTMTDGREREREFVSSRGRALTVRIMPYSPEGKGDRGVVFTILDVTLLRDAVKEAELHQREADERMHEVEQIYRTSPMAMGLIGRDMRYIRVNERLAELNGEALDRHIGATIAEIIPAVAEQTEALVASVFETGRPIRNQRVEGAIRSDPQNMRVWNSDWVPFFEPDGKTVKAVSVLVRDITEEVTIQSSLHRVMRELEHRVKNMLANVTALVNQARREVKTDEEVYAKLTRRIEGLAKTHSLLTAEQWASALLRDVIGPETVEIYGEERVHLKGPAIRVNARTTLALGMAIHELATNAAKYGAFNSAGGSVDITWSRINDAEGDRLQIVWEENGGPEIATPTSSGFGTQLIRSTIEGTLDGRLETQWRREGLRCTILLDYDAVSDLDDA